MSDGLPGDETVPVAGGPSSTVVLENTPKATHWCSFCSKSNNEVKLIITGEAGACICDECIELCRDIIGSARVARDKMFSNAEVSGAGTASAGLPGYASAETTEKRHGPPD